MKPGIAGVLLSSTMAIVSCTTTPEVEFPELGPSSVYHAQVQVGGEGELLLVWTEYQDGWVHLYAARSEGGAFSSPVRVNVADEPLHMIPIDEMRPAVAIGPDRRVGVAWTDFDFNIQAAISTDGGRTFGAPMRLNQDDGWALQEFPAIAFDADGVLHAVWLDPRIAEEGEEEPADLYYGRIENGMVREQNLTAAQESSVCGCCLPHIRVDPDGRITITFRNTTEDGYRDPFRITGAVDGRFGPPEPVSPPIWRITACPISGPIAVDDMTLWLDGSTGVRRLLSAHDASLLPERILTDTPDVWRLRYPPRAVLGAPLGAPHVLLVPGDPAGYLIEARGRTWSVRARDLPHWATSAVVHRGRLVLVGVDQGVLRHESRAW